MKLLAFLFLNLIFVLQLNDSFAQEPAMSDAGKLTHGTAFKDKSRYMELAGIIGQNYYYTSFNTTAAQLLKINSTGNIILQKEIKDEKGKEGIKMVHTVLLLEKNLVLIFSTTNKKTDEVTYSSQNYNPDTFEPAGEQKILYQISTSKSNNYYTEILLSPNRSKLLFKTHTYFPKQNTNVQFHVFDHGMNLVWKKDFSKGDVEYQDIKIDNEGDVFYSYFKYTEQGKKFSSRFKRDINDQYNVVLASYQSKGSNLQEWVFDVQQKWLTDLKFGFSGDGKEIVATGFYSDKKAYGIKGAFYTTLDKLSGKPVKQFIKEFDTEFLYENLSPKKSEKAIKKEEEGDGSGMRNFDFKELIFREDGGIIMVAEQFTITTHCNTTANGNMTCTDTYHYDNIIVISINPNGEIGWAKWIPKRQFCTGQKFVGFYLHVSDKLYFLFTDESKNHIPGVNLKDLEPSNPYHKGAVLALCTMDLNGNLDRKVLSKIDPNELTIIPKAGQQVDDKTSVLLFGDRKNRRFSVFTLK